MDWRWSKKKGNIKNTYSQYEQLSGRCQLLRQISKNVKEPSGCVSLEFRGELRVATKRWHYQPRDEI